MLYDITHVHVSKLNATNIEKKTKQKIILKKNVSYYQKINSHKSFNTRIYI